MQVKEVMTRQVLTVSTEDSVEKCSRLLIENNISSLPVLDENGELVGMVTEGDLIRRTSRIEAPGYLEILGGIIYLGSPKKYVEKIQRAMAYKAGDLMSTDIISADPEDSVKDAATLMLEKSIGRLPVVDDTGKLVGIVSRRDIMKQLYVTDSGE